VADIRRQRVRHRVRGIVKKGGDGQRAQQNRAAYRHRGICCICRLLHTYRVM